MSDFRENAIEWLEGQKTITLTLSSMRLKNKIRKLQDEYPEEVQIVHENEDGTILAKIPLNYLKIYRNPDVTRVLTEEDKEALRENLRKGREKKMAGKE